MNIFNHIFVYILLNNKILIFKLLKNKSTNELSCNYLKFFSVILTKSNFYKSIMVAIYYNYKKKHNKVCFAVRVVLAKSKNKAFI